MGVAAWFDHRSRVSCLGDVTGNDHARWCHTVSQRCDSGVDCEVAVRALRLGRPLPTHWLGRCTGGVSGPSRIGVASPHRQRRVAECRVQVGGKADGGTCGAAQCDPIDRADRTNGGGQGPHAAARRFHVLPTSDFRNRRCSAIRPVSVGLEKNRRDRCGAGRCSGPPPNGGPRSAEGRIHRGQPSAGSRGAPPPEAAHVLKANTRRRVAPRRASVLHRRAVIGRV